MDEQVAYRSSLANMAGLTVLAGTAEPCNWKGAEALRVEDGLVVLPVQPAADAVVEVEIGADGPAYPGIAFRIRDRLNFELAYAQPHTSGLWDALQYDPVFHGSNTWQVHHGEWFQKEAAVPTGEWFRFRVGFAGSEAQVSLNDQPALRVPRLAHPHRSGLIGLWTYRPAYFRNFRVRAAESGGDPGAPGECTRGGHAATGPCPDKAGGGDGGDEGGALITGWMLQDYGVVGTEPSGVLLVNRYLPLSLREAALTRRFRAAARTQVAIRCGFSDTLDLSLDGNAVFSGRRTFASFGDREGRAYVELAEPVATVEVDPGEHQLRAVLGVTEPFGWGLALSLEGQGLSLLPAWMS